jgi:predicted glycosyltransferase
VRVWIDLANSPHVPLFRPVVTRLRSEGHEVVLTARDHAQTLPLTLETWPETEVVGGPSPDGRLRKGTAIAGRALALLRFARRTSPDVALSHGSYAQIAAARLARVPAVTMMDYEFQPANHLSFRLAQRVIVPEVFPTDALRRFGAGERKVVRYVGFKEDLYLGATGDRDVLGDLGVDARRIVAVLRPPPEGALYHRGGNDRFEAVLDRLEADEDVEIVLLPRGREQRERYTSRRVRVPEKPVDGTALLAAADLVVGAGGTMTREAALLGTPTYTVFMPELAAVDSNLMQMGRIVDLRQSGFPPIEKKHVPSSGTDSRDDGIMRTVLETLTSVAVG